MRAPTYSAALEQARMNALRSAAGSGAKLWVYGGTRPASPDTAGHGQTLLLGPYVFGSNLGATATLALPSILTADCSSVTPKSGLATATPVWWRLTTSSGSDGSAGLCDGNVDYTGNNWWPSSVSQGALHGMSSWKLNSFEISLTNALIGSAELADSDAVTGNAQVGSGSIGATNIRTGVFYPGNNGPANALYVAAANDIITVIPGTYIITQKMVPTVSGITVQSSVPGVKAVLDSRQSIYSYLVDIRVDLSITLVDLEFIGWKNSASSPVDNSVCIYTQGGTYTVTLRRCKISEFGCGVLIGYHPNGAIVMESTEIDNCGNYQGYTHAIYTACYAVTLRGCWIHCSKSRADYVAAGLPEWMVSWGHLVKVRSSSVLIEGCRLTMENGESNRCIDSPNGGDLTVRGNLIEFRTSQNAPYSQFMSFGVEAVVNPVPVSVHKLKIYQNTFVNHAKDGSYNNLARYFLWIMTNTTEGIGQPLSTYDVRDNVFAGDFLPANKDGWYGSEGNVYAVSTTTNTVYSMSQMATAMPAHASYDFTLAAPVTGSQNWAPYSYSHPAQYAARTDAGRGGVPNQNWGNGTVTGSYSNFVWTPGRDASGVVNAASWALVPTYTWVKVAGTLLNSLDSVVKANVAGWTDFGSGKWDGVTNAWNGMAWDTRPGSERGWLVCAGGHADSSNDGIYRFDVRKMSWGVQRYPMATSLMDSNYAYAGTYTDYGPAYAYFFSNQANPEGVYVDEFYDPAHPDAAHSPRTPTARHTYSSSTFVPELGSAGKLMTGCRRFWVYDIGTNTWALPKFPFGTQVGYNANGALGFSGENMSGWWDSVEQRYHCFPSQNYSASSAWSINADGTGGRWESIPYGGWQAFYTPVEVIGRKLWTLIYDNTGGFEGKPKVMVKFNMDTKAQEDADAVVLGSSFSGLSFSAGGWDGQGMTYVPDNGKWLCNVQLSTGTCRWCWLDATTWTLDLISNVSNDQLAGNYNTHTIETKVKYIPDIHAVIWVETASSEVWVLKLA